MKSLHEQVGKTQIWTQCVDLVPLLTFFTMSLKPVAFPVSIFLIDLHTMASVRALRIRDHASFGMSDLLRLGMVLRRVRQMSGRCALIYSGYAFKSKMISPTLTSSFGRGKAIEPTSTPRSCRKRTSSFERLVPRATGNFDGIWGRVPVMEEDKHDFLQHWLFGQNQ